MKDTEVLALYYQAASVTPGDPTDHAADMWCEILRDLDYAPTRAALIELLKTQTFVSPAEIRKKAAPQREWFQL
jgi:hypothetical protein